MSTKAENLKDLLVHELRDLHSAEGQILKALPKLEASATSSELKSAFREHRSQTQSQLTRLDTLLSHMDVSPGRVTCKGMRGILEEGEEALSLASDPEVRDAALIGAAQRVEHYEISSYGTARAYARQLGDNFMEKELARTLQEEKDADQRLTAIAEKVNPQAR